jgi:hypothetical protein
MAHILVGLNLSNGLTDTITIKTSNSNFCQELDYEGIPSKCGCCHYYGHIDNEFSLPGK